MVGGLIFYWKWERKKQNTPSLDSYPPFSVIIPCHNEETLIKETLNYLSQLDYPEYEIIAVDDGSTDTTSKILKEYAQKLSNMRVVYLKENKGKAYALNVGTAVAKHEFILTLDADAFVDKNALKWLAWHFVKFPRVGAVTGNPRVINRTTLLGKIQTGEYSTIIGLIKRTQRVLGKVLTVSGVMAAFRKQALISVSLWDTDMVTEDIDITWKLEKKFWDIRYEPRALSWIHVPETLRGLWRQRLRWAQGGIEVLQKHKDIWMNWKQRRLWPIYTEYILSIFWVYSFWLVVLLWSVQAIFSIIMPVKILPPIPPLWTGSILAMVCLTQFVISISIDRIYDKKLLKSLFLGYMVSLCLLDDKRTNSCSGTPESYFQEKR